MIHTRNLIYHCSPFDGNDVWLRNLAQLRRRWRVFNGRRIVSVATGPGMVPLERVKRFLPDAAIEWLTFPNCKIQRECTSFYPMLDMLTPSPFEATFYAHAKGVTRNPCDDNVTSWRNNMYANLLDRAERCMDLLASHPCVGCYRMFHRAGGLRKATHLTDRERACEWHYAGTYFWFRNSHVLGRDDWRSVLMGGWAVEFYLPQLFRHSQAACVYGDNPPPSLYKQCSEPRLDPPDWPAIFLED